MTFFPLPLAPAVCDTPDPGGVIPAVCLPETAPVGTLAEVVGDTPGNLLGGGGLDAVAAHLNQLGSTAPVDVMTPAVVLAAFAVVALLLAAYIGYAIGHGGAK